MKVPKIIHFIWAGGLKLMPDENISNVLQWHQRNPDFDIYIWIDPFTAPHDIIEQYRETFQKLAKEAKIDLEKIRFTFKDIEGQQDSSLSGKAASAETAGKKVSDLFSRYEIDRLRPNYGASSDLLRYRILHEIGGAFFDSDIIPGQQSLTESRIFDDEYETPHLWVDHNSQGTLFIGNDALICTPGHPSIDLIHQIAMRNYIEQATFEIHDPSFQCTLTCDFPERNILAYQAYHYDDYSGEDGYILATTPFKTGPTVVQLVADKQCDQEPHRPDSARILSMQELTTPAREQGLQWVGKAIRQFDSLPYAIECVCNTISFEAENLHMIRLDDHIKNLAESTRTTEEEVIPPLFASLTQKIESQEIDLSKAIIAQLTFRYPETREFYSRHTIPIQRCAIIPELESPDFSRLTYAHSIIGTLFTGAIRNAEQETDLHPLKPKERQKASRDIDLGCDSVERILALCNTLTVPTQEARLKLVEYLEILEQNLDYYSQLIEKPWMSENSQKLNALRERLTEKLTQLRGEEDTLRNQSVAIFTEKQ